MKYDDIKVLTRRVDTLGKRQYKKAAAAAVPLFPLLGLVQIETIGDDETDFWYTPETRNYVMGDPSPASCKSVPSRVEENQGMEIRGFNTRHELGYEICKFDCKDDSLSEIIKKKERSVAIGMMHFLAKRFWVGNPSLLQFGITNHPAVTHVESPHDGTSGSSMFKHKTNDQIMKFIRGLMKNMINPVVMLSELSYEDSLGSIDDSSSKCNLRADCITKSLKDQQNINFKGPIRFSEELDQVPDFDGENLMLVFDSGALKIKSSGLIWQGSYNDGKTVFADRLINTSGLVIENYDSVFVVTGV